MNRDKLRKYIKIIFPISVIILGVFLGIRYIIGFFLGYAMGLFMMLFPSPMFLAFLDKEFDYSGNMARKMQKESEKRGRIKVRSRWTDENERP